MVHIVVIFRCGHEWTPPRMFWLGGGGVTGGANKYLFRLDLSIQPYPVVVIEHGTRDLEVYKI